MTKTFKRLYRDYFLYNRHFTYAIKSLIIKGNETADLYQYLKQYRVKDE